VAGISLGTAKHWLRVGKVDSVDRARWQLAQSGEARYWHSAQSALGEQSRILAEKIEALVLAEQAVPDLGRRGGLKVEVGIGPLGVGVLHFLSTNGTTVGLDPLPALRSVDNLPRPMTALVQACWEKYTHLQARGEEIPLLSDSASLVASYNVLDHVQDPPAVLREIYRILEPGGYFLLSCDTVSLASLLKFHVYSRRRDKETLSVICHPFRFWMPRLEELVRRTGFSILWVHEPRWKWLATIVGHAFRSLLVAQKPAFIPAEVPRGRHAA
jgi:SAM-dependent methyltransferase